MSKKPASLLILMNPRVYPACNHSYKWLRLTLIVLVLTLSFTGFAQYNVTGIYTDYQGGWASSATTINPVKPSNNHNLIGFTWNGTTFSTGVNNALMTSQEPLASLKDFRAFPIDGVSTSASPLLGLGQLYDGVSGGASTPPPFNVPAGSATLAGLLTDGIKGLNIGTGIANIAAGDLRFNLSSLGISASAIDDDVPDVLVTQIAEPGTTFDLIYFIDADGNTVGNQLSIKQSVIPKVGTWLADFYTVGGSISFANTDKDYRLWAADLTSFGINGYNVASAVALIYRLNGASDVAFVAFNVPSISVATQLSVTTQPSASIASACCGNVNSSTLSQAPVVQVQDGSGHNILQSGIPITASILSGPAGYGALQGTLTAITNAQGQATFTSLRMPCETGDYVLQFSSSSLDLASTNTITVTGAQNFYVRSGSSSNLANLASWSSTADGGGAMPADFGTGKAFNLSNSSGENNFSTGSNWAVNGKLVIPVGSTLSITGSTITSLYCDIDHRGSIQGTSGTLSLLGNATQILDGTTDVRNMTFNNASGVTLNGNTTITQSANLTAGVVRINGSKFSVESITRTSGSIDASATGSTVAFTGTAAPTLSSVVFPTAVYNLEMNTSGAATLGSAFTVTNNINHLNGTISLGGYKLTAGTVTGGSSTSYIKTGGSGTLAMNVPAGSAVQFPVGGTAYDPVIVTNNNTVADIFNVRVLADVYENGSSGSTMTEARIKRSWSVVKTNANTGAGFSLSFQWNAPENSGVTLPALYAYSGDWTKQTSGSSLFTAPVNFSYSGYTGSASVFSLFDNAVALPVTWASFTAQKMESTVKLEWATAMELNTRSFGIFRSTDGQTWQQLGQQPAAGASDELRTYQFIDEAPAGGINYYRIRQTDIDGRSAYTQILSVRMDEPSTFRVLGNPVTGKQLRVITPAATAMEVIDATGKRVLVRRIAAGINTINLGSLAAGTYTVRAQGVSVMIVVKN